MKFTSSILALATLAVILPTQAQQRPYMEGQASASTVPLAVGDPLKIIYRISGVKDSGGGFSVGVATSIHCTNFGLVSETVRYVIKHWNGVVAKNATVTIPSGHTITASTHGTNVFNEDLYLTKDVEVSQGSAIIYSTSPQTVFCSAMIVDAAANGAGVSLHMVRYNPITGTQ